MTTPTDPTAARIERALAAAGLGDCEVRHAQPHSALIVVDDTFLRITRVDFNSEGVSVGLDDERVVALVRAVLAGGWAADVAELGVVPTVDAMLAYAAGRGWWSEVSNGASGWFAGLSMGGGWFANDHGRDTPAEALGRALLLAVAGEGAT